MGENKKIDGYRQPVKLVPKGGTATAMHFMCDSKNFPGNMPDVISWLGSAFYCLTDGEEVIIKGKKITRACASDPDVLPLDAMTIVILDDVHDSLVVARSGDWIIWSESTGYTVKADELIAQAYNIVGLDDTEDESVLVVEG